MNWLRFYPDVILHKGFLRSTLYFLGENKTIHLTKLESDILNYLLDHSVEDCREAYGTDDTQVAINAVLKYAMGNLYKGKVYSEKYKPHIDFWVEQFFQPDFSIYQFHIQLPSKEQDCRINKTMLVHEGCNSSISPNSNGMDTQIYQQKILDNLDEMKRIRINRFIMAGGNPVDCWDFIMKLLAVIKENFNCTTEIVFPINAIPDYILNDMKSYNILLKYSTMVQNILCDDNVLFNEIKKVAFHDFDVKMNLIYDTSQRINHHLIKEKLESYDISGVDYTHLIHSPNNKLIALSTSQERIEDIGMDLYYNKRSCMKGKIAVTIDGNVRPCAFSSHILGNLSEGVFTVFKKNLHSPYWEHNKEHVSRCKGCENRFACIDCAIVEEAMEANPNYLSVLCDYHPEQGTWENENHNEEKFVWQL